MMLFYSILGQYEKNLCPIGSVNCKPCPGRLPSCVGQPDGSQSYPGDPWKPDYVTCYKNRTVLPIKHCTKGYFHPTQKICTEEVTKGMPFYLLILSHIQKKSSADNFENAYSKI